MKQTATVIEDGEIATVEIMRSSACDGCHKHEGGGCVTCDIFGMSKKMTAKAKNEAGAKKGDRVILETASGRVLGYAAFVFMFPIISGLLFYLVADYFSESQALPYLVSLAGFVLSFAVIYFTVNKRAKSRYDITIVSIVGKNGE